MLSPPNEDLLSEPSIGFGLGKGDNQQDDDEDVALKGAPHI